MQMDKPETLSMWSITFRTNEEHGYAANHYENIVAHNMESAIDWVKANRPAHHLRIINVTHKGVVSAVIEQGKGE